MIAGELIRNKEEFVESLRQTLKGWQGLRNYLVNTIDPAQAVFAHGVPKEGDPWGTTPASADLALLKVTERETFLMGGKDSGDGSGGATRVQVLYETPTFTGVRTGKQGQTWTDFTPARGQFNQLKSLGRVSLGSSGEILGGEFAANTAVANGDGCQVDYGLVECRVYTFHDLSAGLDVGRLAGLMRPSKINNAPLTLPALYPGSNGGGSFFSFAKGQVRYVSFEPSIVNNLRQLVHVLEVSEDFYFRWAPKDHSGQPAGDPFGDRVYYYDDFADLW